MKAHGSETDETDAAHQFQVESKTPPYSEKPLPQSTPVSIEHEMNGNAANDTEPIVKGFEFNEATIRRGFIRKVYGLLSVSFFRH